MEPQVFFLSGMFFLQSSISFFIYKSTDTIYSYTADDGHEAASKDRPPCQEQPQWGQRRQRHVFFFFLHVLLILTNGFYFILFYLF